MGKPKKKSKKAQTHSISSDIVDYFRQDGMSLKQIGNLAELSESFISRVWRGKREFTIKHLLKFAKALNQPLVLLLIAVNKDDSLHQKIRDFYRSSKYKIPSRFSRDVLKYLREKKKMTMQKIASLAGVSRPFLYRVANGKTTFAIKHLVELERKMGKSLPLGMLGLLPKNASPEEKKSHLSLKKVLNSSYQRRQHLPKKGKKTS